MNALNNELARYEAQRLAFAPLMFQACRALRDVGILEQVARARQRGVTCAEAVQHSGLSRWAASLLLEAGFASGLCTCDVEAEEPRFVITPMGLYWLHDPLTRVNAEFNHHVCYQGAFHLREALLEGRPAGLPAIDATGAGTVYEALHALKPEVRRAWFDFDHYYSDGVFEACLPRVLAGAPRRLVDIGGNTGKFAQLCLTRDPQLEVTLVDLPPQLAEAKTNLAAFGERARFSPLDVRDDAAPFPAGADVYWLSQFLDCFSEAEIRSILTRVRQAMPAHGRVFILETYWNEQRFDAARFCVIGTSLYFACIANGTSRMYHSAVMKRLIAEAGLAVREEVREVGLSHTLLVCGPA
ncbi:MAG: methyltransferase [Myxococcota bacterium]